MLQPKQRESDMRFGTWNVRNLYRAGSVTAAARELGIHIVNVNFTEDFTLCL